MNEAHDVIYSLLNLSGPPFASLYDGDYLLGLLQGLNEIMNTKCFTQCQVQEALSGSHYLVGYRPRLDWHFTKTTTACPSRFYETEVQTGANYNSLDQRQQSPEWTVVVSQKKMGAYIFSQTK